MNGLDAMTREELLELAPLDAFGLLDEVEAALFHRAFHRAPAAVQAEVIALQAELAEADHFLADEEPREILRRKVFLRLEEVIDESTDGLRPIALIGSRGPDAAHPAAATDDGRSDPESLAAFRSLMEEFAERNARSARRTTPFWRAAAIVLGTATVVSLSMLRESSEHAKKISELVITQGLEGQIGLMVPDLQARLAAGARSLGMTPSEGQQPGLASATLVVDADRREVIVLGMGLPRLGSGPFRCQAVPSTGRAVEIASVDADRPLASAVGALPAGFTAVRYELVDPEGTVVFSVDA